MSDKVLLWSIDNQKVIRVQLADLEGGGTNAYIVSITNW
jgi:hypothetical protein